MYARWSPVPPLWLDDGDFIWVWDKREGHLPKLSIAWVMRCKGFPTEYWIHDRPLKSEEMKDFLFYTQKLGTPLAPTYFDLDAERQDG